MTSLTEIAAHSPSGRPWARVLAYFGLVALTVGGFLAVRYFGTDLTAASPALATEHFGAVDSKVKVDVLMHLLTRNDARRAASGPDSGASLAEPA